MDLVKDFNGSQFNYQGNLGSALDGVDQHILENLMHKIKDIKILDPAVGTGEFLIEAFLSLKAIYDYLSSKGICDWNDYQIREWIITQNLYGVDISQSAIDACRSNLSAVLYSEEDHNGSLPDLNGNIRCGNSLIGFLLNEPNQSKSMLDNLEVFHWNHEFPRIVENKGFDICLGNPPWNVYKPLSKEFFAQFDPRLTKYGVDKKEAKRLITKLLEQNYIKRQWEEYKQKIRQTGNYYRGGNYCYQSGQIHGGNGLKTIS